jgi:hypothetical protein
MDRPESLIQTELLDIETPGNATTCGPWSSTSTAPYSVFGNHRSHTEAEAAGY